MNKRFDVQLMRWDVNRSMKRQRAVGILKMTYYYQEFSRDKKGLQTLQTNHFPFPRKNLNASPRLYR